MMLYNNKMLLLLWQCQRLKLYYLQHSFKALLTKQIGLYLKPHINFYLSFFQKWSFLSLELKPTRRYNILYLLL